ncbi:hypothetical protein XH99_11345 [Bradyrhizobium nanningense]|uniref:Uncharacterized protein n=2 Tax=Bradyrhizobium nanningense TaxID=1325118 RepID=A0A4Q0S9Y2_9BRAD|nr:hypothetical protein XH84_31640 [Bradyrhizobium nanningense]RXH30981.1 hypothetical protein XH99_11345 [Bradyrhizobium nanningense]
MQMLIGYVLFCSTPFAHGRLIFTGADTREYRFIPITSALFLMQAALLIFISLAVHALGDPNGTAYALLHTPTVCSIVLYLASEHFITTARSVDNSYYLGMAGAIRLLSAAALFGIGTIFKSTNFDQFLLSISAASLIISFLGLLIFADKYQLVRELRKLWSSAQGFRETATFALHFSFLPLCAWIQNLSGRLIVSTAEAAAPGYTIYSFAATNASIVTLVVFDSMRSTLYNVRSSQHINYRWIRTFRLTALVNLAAFFLYGCFVVLAVYYYTSAYNIPFDPRWHALLSLSIALTYFSGISEWLCISVGQLRILNFAMGASTIFFAAYLFVEQMLRLNDLSTGLIVSSILSNLIFALICIIGNWTIVTRLLAPRGDLQS